MQWPLDKEIATCFYTAISTDCGSFRYANTTPKTMRNAAKLLEYGVQPNEISDALDVRSRDTVEMLAKVLPSLTFAYEAKLLISQLPTIYMTRMSRPTALCPTRAILRALT